MSNFKPLVHTYTTPRYLPVNVYLVETENGVVVVDGATALSTSREIRGIIDNQIKKPILAVLLTHGHPDHYAGVKEILNGLDVPFISTQLAYDFCRYQDEHKADTLIHKNYGDDAPPVRMFPNRIERDGAQLTFDGVQFALCDMGPCESGGDTTWTMTVDGVKHVFIGDLIYNHTHSYFRDGHALEWLNALDRLGREYDHNAVFYPGHGELCGTEMVHWEKGYILAFLTSLESMLRGRDALNDAEKEQLVARMKSYMPTEKLLNLLKYEFDETIRILSKIHEVENVLTPRQA